MMPNHSIASATSIGRSMGPSPHSRLADHSVQVIGLSMVPVIYRNNVADAALFLTLSDAIGIAEAKRNRDELGIADFCLRPLRHCSRRCFKGHTRARKTKNPGASAGVLFIRSCALRPLLFLSAFAAASQEGPRLRESDQAYHRPERGQERLRARSPNSRR
jgi:hypothetical protein